MEILSPGLPWAVRRLGALDASNHVCFSYLGVPAALVINARPARRPLRARRRPLARDGAMGPGRERDRTRPRRRRRGCRPPRKPQEPGRRTASARRAAALSRGLSSGYAARESAPSPGARANIGGEEEARTDLATAIGAIFCASGAWLAVKALGQLSRRWAFVRRSAIADGVVVGVRDESDPTDVTGMRRPRIRFRTATGREDTFDSAVATGGDAWREGQVVGVRYEIDNPAVAERDAFWALWGAATVLRALATAFAGLGLALLVA